MPVKNAKVRNAAPPVTKICSKCNQTKLLSDYYSNRDWTEQLGKDVWCKSCVSQCSNKDELREYFWFNNRDWNEKVWTNARKKAELAANKNEVYQRAYDETKKSILDRMTVQNVIKAMQVNYKFVDHTNDINVQTYEEAKEAGHVKTEEKEEDDPNVKKYSEFFNGYFKADELSHLEQYYKELSQDFDLTDVNLRDTAKKLAKQSLICDRIQDKYAAGQATILDVKAAFDLYDTLSKSGNFAACKRPPGDKGGLGSFGELTLYLETHGKPMTRKIEWEKDDIDRIIDEYRHLSKALGLDQT